MVQRIRSEENAIVLRFGGGIHSRASENLINPMECVTGANFLLDVENSEFRNRPPFDLVWTAPNAGRINGFINLLKADGSAQLAIQADNDVYEWDGASTTAIATVSSGARLRGRLEHNYQLEDVVLVTDVASVDEVYVWDGTGSLPTLSSFSAYTGPASFKAKYCQVENERAVFANIVETGGSFPHLIVASERDDYLTIASGATATDRAQDATLGAEAAWWLVQPDLRAINGLVTAYGVIVTSSIRGDVYRLSGNDATDFSMTPLFPRAGATGRESMAYVGNDIHYGREGRIESLAATDEFGDVETNDLTLPIQPDVTTYNDWYIEYVERLQRVYCHPVGSGEMWVLYKPLLGSDVSPWMRFTTEHTMNMNPTAMMNCIDPETGVEQLLFGDENGNVYRMEGSGSSGDGGTTDVMVERLSGMFQMDLDSSANHIDGWATIRAGDAQEILLTIEYAGDRIFEHRIDLTLAGQEVTYYYGGSFYYGEAVYYNKGFRGKLQRKGFEAPGGSTEFQVRIYTKGTSDVAVQEIGLRFSESS